MVSCTDVKVVDLIRLIALLGVWACIAWPLWSYLFVTTTYRVLDFMPLLVNAWSLTGMSYESKMTDWRVWIVSLSLPALLVWASLYGLFVGIDWPGCAIALVAVLLSILGSLPGFHVNSRVGESYERMVTLTKVVFLCLLVGLLMWGLDFALDYSLNKAIPQFLLGSAVLVALFLSLAYIRSIKRHGVGSPLLWLAIRLLLCPGVPYFWAWLLFCIVSFEVLNVCHKRPTTLKAMKEHWHGWQSLPCANSFFLLNLSFGIAVLVSNGDSLTTTVSLGSSVVTFCQNNALIANMVQEYQKTLCLTDSWMIPYLQTIVDSRFDCTGVQITTHKMFESEAAILAVVVLLASSCGFVLATLKDPKSSQSYWIPIFFFATAVMILLYDRTTIESLGLAQKRIVSCWSDDSILAICMSIAGGLIGALISAFSLGRKGILRERTRFLSPGYQGTNLFNVVLLGFELITILACFLWFIAGQTAVVYTNQTAAFPLGAVTELNNESDIAGWMQLFAYSSLTSSQRDTLLTNSNCSTEGCYFLGNDRNRTCSQPLPGDAAWATSLSLVQSTSVSFVFWSTDISLSILMQNELLATGVISVLGLFCTMAAIRIPILDDWSLLMTVTAAIIFALAIPLRLKEFRALTSVSLLEWQILVAVVSIVLSTAVAVVIRIDVGIPCNPWKTVDEMESDFMRSSKSTMEDFVYHCTGIEPIGEGNIEIYNNLDLQIKQLYEQKGIRFAKDMKGEEIETELAG